MFWSPQVLFWSAQALFWSPQALLFWSPQALLFWSPQALFVLEPMTRDAECFVAHGSRLMGGPTLALGCALPSSHAAHNGARARPP